MISKYFDNDKMVKSINIHNSRKFWLGFQILRFQINSVSGCPKKFLGIDQISKKSKREENFLNFVWNSEEKATEVIFCLRKLF